MSDQPDRLAELSRRLTEAGIKHEADEHVLSVRSGVLTVLVLPDGRHFSAIDGSSFVSPGSIVARMFPIAREVFGE